MKRLSSEKGFTLVELLIVIVIIGLLAGVTLSIINPQRQFRRSGEGSARAVAQKACMALTGCGNSTLTLANCNSLLEIGAISPGVPTTVTPSVAGTVVTLTTAYTGYGSTCNFTCGYDFGTSLPVAFAVGATCII